MKNKDDEPFGRQPKSVKVTVDGETIDTRYWVQEFMRRVESRGDNAQQLHDNIFMIYPHAVNE